MWCGYEMGGEMGREIERWAEYMMGLVQSGRSDSRPRPQFMHAEGRGPYPYYYKGKGIILSSSGDRSRSRVVMQALDPLHLPIESRAHNPPRGPLIDRVTSI
jgi:hypothetical protein